MPSLRTAVVTPVGPAAVDLYRGVELIKSLLLWEPDVEWIVVVDDSPHARGLSEVAPFSKSGRIVITLMNPRRGAGHHWSGGVATGLLVALDWVHANTDADIILIIETDALVIASFADAVRAFLHDLPDAGMIGTLGQTCNDSILQDFRREPALLAAYRLVPTEEDERDIDAAKPRLVYGLGMFSQDQRRQFGAVRPHVAAAVAHGYASSEYCQGGAHVVTRLMVDRMARAGYFQHSDVWMDLPFFGSSVLPMYARAVGLQLYACVAAGQPFGVQYRGLPFTLEELVERGHGLIHSIKNDSRYSEKQIREFFGKRAAAAPGRMRNLGADRLRDAIA